MESQRKSAPTSVRPSSSENNTAITSLIDGIMGQIVESSSSPGSTNAGCTDPCTSATSEDLQVASSKLADSVLDETEGTSGKQGGNLKSTRSDWKPKLQPAFKKFLVHLNIKNRNWIVQKILKEELPAEAPAEEPTSPTEKNKKDQMSTNAPLSENLNEDVGCTDPCMSTTSEDLQVASSKLTDSVLDKTEGTENLQSTRSDWKPKLQPAFKKFLVHLNIKNRNWIVQKILKEELPAEAPAEEPTSPTEKNKKDQMSTNAPLSENVNEDVGCTDPCMSTTSEDLQVASSKLTDSVLDKTDGTENLQSTRSDWKPKLQPAFKKFLVHLNIKNRNPIVRKIPKEELPAEAPAEEPTSTTEKNKKDQILAFFGRSWRTMKRIFTKRSNKISPA